MVTENQAKGQTLQHLPTSNHIISLMSSRRNIPITKSIQRFTGRVGRTRRRGELAAAGSGGEWQLYSTGLYPTLGYVHHTDRLHVQGTTDTCALYSAVPGPRPTL